ncbi:monooxygenase domain protein [Mycobacterium intracellulare 1956]|uniref:Monooxygenase domain protein n=1 Tax=Mycobacterium intracellulare 1956 TaxID=1299331 RepID=X8CRS9_MYCIT|nr:monooxygenase domain protein [Mycobacterium intracellulare 1956]
MAQKPLLGTERQASHGRVHPVGTDNQVIALAVAGIEPHIDATVIVVEFADGFVEPQFYRRPQAVAQDGCEVFPRDFDVAGGVVDLVERRFGHHGAVFVDELDAFGHIDPVRADRCEHAHLVGDTDGVPANVDRGAVHPQVVGAFDQGDVVAVGAEVYRRAQAADSGTGDENAHRFHSCSL